MTKQNAPSTSTSRMMVIGAVAGCIACIGGMAAMVLIAIDKIRTGHGLDTFRSHWLVEDNWVGFLVSLAVITVVAILAPVIGWYQRRQEQREIQQLQAKYSEKHHG